MRDSGRWHSGDRHTWIVLDSGYDRARLAFLLADLPVQLIARLRSDRARLWPFPERCPGSPNRRPRHGPPLTLAQPATWAAPASTALRQELVASSVAR